MNQADTPELERATMRSVLWRILPYLIICYLVSYIDRVNVGFAALEMRHDIDLNPTVFGAGASLFLVTNFLFAVPSCAVLKRVGARRWVSLQMVVWGMISMAMCTIQGPTSFYVYRMALGAVEAGFFPGVIYYISQWFPSAYRARVSALFLLAIPGSSFIGSPISVVIMQMHDLLGIYGWQWLFLLEGVPAVLLGIGFYIWMKDSPDDVRWLTPVQRQWLSDTLERESAQIRVGDGDHGHVVAGGGLWRSMFHPTVLALSVIYSGVISVGICLSFWQPQIINAFGLSTLGTGLLNAVPFGIAILAMIAWGRSSDYFDDRVWHTFIALVVSAVALLATAWLHSLVATIVILTFALVGTYSAKGPFWAMVTEWLPANISAVGIGMVSAVGTLAAALSTYLLGVIQKATGSFTLALMPLIALAVASAVVQVVMGIRYRGRMQGQASAARTRRATRDGDSDVIRPARHV